MTVEPQRTALKSAVKLQRTVPDVCCTGILVHNVWQHEDALTLLHDARSTTKGTTGKCGGIGCHVGLWALRCAACCLL